MKESLKRAIYKYRATHHISRVSENAKYYAKRKIYILWLREFSNFI